MQSSRVDDKYVEELFEAELEDNTETGSENIDKQGTKNPEEKGEQADNKEEQEDKKKSDKTRDRDSIQSEKRRRTENRR
jgi:hypothetical protein